MSFIVYWPIIAAISAIIGLGLIVTSAMAHFAMVWKIILFIFGVILLGAGLLYFMYLWGLF